MQEYTGYEYSWYDEYRGFRDVVSPFDRAVCAFDYYIVRCLSADKVDIKDVVGYITERIYTNPKNKWYSNPNTIALLEDLSRGLDAFNNTRELIRYARRLKREIETFFLAARNSVS